MGVGWNPWQPTRLQFGEDMTWCGCVFVLTSTSCSLRVAGTVTTVTSPIACPLVCDSAALHLRCIWSHRRHPRLLPRVGSTRRPADRGVVCAMFAIDVPRRVCARRSAGCVLSRLFWKLFLGAHCVAWSDSPVEERGELGCVNPHHRPLSA